MRHGAKYFLFFTFEVDTTRTTSENVKDLVDSNITAGFHIEAYSDNNDSVYPTLINGRVSRQIWREYRCMKFHKI